MQLAEAKIIADSKLWPFFGISRDKWRRDLEDLETKGIVSPKRSLTGRAELSFSDLVKVAQHYGLTVDG